MVVQARAIYNRDAFAASGPLETLKSGRAIHSLTLGITAQSAAGVAFTAAALADLVQPLEVRLMGSPVIQMRGSDLWALNVLHLKKNPVTMDAPAVITQRGRIQGLEVPVRQPARSIGDLSMRCTRVAVANANAETLALTENSSDVADPLGYYHAVEMPMVLRAAVGYGNFLDLPQPGDLHGILFWNTTIPAVAADTASALEVMVEVDKNRAYMRTFDEMRADAPFHASFASPGNVTFLDNYAYLDLSHEPIPKESEVRLDINAGVANDPIRVIPIYRVKGT